MFNTCANSSVHFSKTWSGWKPKIEIWTTISELLKSTKKAQEDVALVTEESAKSKAAKEVIKSLTAQDRLDKTEIRLAKSAVPSNVIW